MTKYRTKPAASAIQLALAMVLTACSGPAAEQTLAANQPSRIAATDQVLVARADLPAGTIVNERKLRWAARSEGDPSDGAFLVKGHITLKDVQGSAVRRDVRAGQPLLKDQLIGPGDRKFLSAVLMPGHRAYGFVPNNVAVTHGTMLPGNRIDILFSHKIVAERGSIRVPETILNQVRVLALFQIGDNPRPRPGGRKGITIETTPEQAEFLTLASSMGKLSIRPSSQSANRRDPPPARRGNTFTDEVEVRELMRRDPSSVIQEPYRGQPLTECSADAVVPAAPNAARPRPLSTCDDIVPAARKKHRTRE